MNRQEEAIMSLVVGLPALVTLIWLDWKIALCIICIVWANNFNTVMKNDVRK